MEGTRPSRRGRGVTKAAEEGNESGSAREKGGDAAWWGGAGTRKWNSRRAFGGRKEIGRAHV